MSGIWFLNEQGLWCVSCGNCIMTDREISEDSEEPEICNQCGFPDNIEQMAEYHP